MAQRSIVKRKFFTITMLILIMVFVLLIPACDDLTDLLFPGQAVPQITIKINGALIPSSGSFLFEDVAVGEEVSVLVTIENTGNEILRIAGITFLSATPHFEGDWDLLSSVGANQTASFTVTFRPSDVGTWEAAVAVSSDAGNFGQFTFVVSGTGISVALTSQYALTMDVAPDASFGSVTKSDVAITETAETYEIWAEPNNGFEFLQWEIVAGTGVIITDPSAAYTTVFLSETNATVRAVFQPITGWNSELVDGDSGAGLSSDLALDNADRPYVSYYSSGNSVKLARWTGSAWVLTTVDSSANTQADTSIALHENSGEVYPHISFYDVTNMDLRYAEWTNGATWAVQTIDSDVTDDIGSQSALALDTVTNDAFVSYIVNGNELRVINQTTGTWGSFATVDPLGSSWSDIAWNSGSSRGNPVVSYIDTGGNLRFAYFLSSWSTEVVDSAGNGGTNTAVVIDGSGNIHIVYADTTLNVIKYAVYTGTWSVTPTNLGNGTDPISGVSLDVDGSGIPHISFVLLNSLVYAYRDGTDWMLETVVAGNVAAATSTSLVLNGAGSPFISFAYQGGGLGLAQK
jgi:hypothetical protein